MAVFEVHPETQVFFIFLNRPYFDFRLEKLENSIYTFSPYGLEKLEKEKWTNGSNFLFSNNQIQHKMDFQN